MNEMSRFKARMEERCMGHYWQTRMTLYPIRFLLRLTALACVLLANANGQTGTDELTSPVDLLPTPTSSQRPVPQRCAYSNDVLMTFLSLEERKLFYRSQIQVKESQVLSAMQRVPERFREITINRMRESIGEMRSQINQAWLYDYPGLKKLSQAAEFVLALWVPFLFGTVGNSLVLYTVISYLKNKSATNILLASLALADLLNLFLCVPLKTFTKLKSEFFHIGYGCAFIDFIQHVFYHSSTIHLIVMALERYLTICHPLKSKLISTPKNIKRSIAISYIISVILTVPTIFTYGEQAVVNTGSKWCREGVECVDFIYNQYESPLWQALRIYPYVVVECVVYFGATVILVVCYVLVGQTLHESIKEAQKLKAGTAVLPLGAKKIEDHDASSRMRIVKMLIVVVIFFILCWGPITMINLFNNVRLGFYSEFRDQNKNLAWAMRNGFYALALTNSCVNPFIYLVMSRSFRRGFLAGLRCGRKQEGSVSRKLTWQSKLHSDTTSEATVTESTLG